MIHGTHQCQADFRVVWRRSDFPDGDGHKRIPRLLGEAPLCYQFASLHQLALFELNLRGRCRQLGGGRLDVSADR